MGRLFFSSNSPYPAPPRPRNAVRRHGDKQRIQDHSFLVVYTTSVDLYERDTSPTSASGVVLSLVLSLVNEYSFHCTCPWPGARRRRLSSSFCRTSGALSHRMRKVVRAERLTAADSGCEGKTRCQSASPPHAGGAARQRPRCCPRFTRCNAHCRFIWTEYQR
jgi:hypothetical protein